MQMTLSEILQNALAAVAIVVSLVAIFVSLHANATSDKAYKLSVDGFNADRRIALKSERTDDGLVFKPLEDAQQIHDVTIYFPSELNIGTITLTPPEIRIYDTRVNPSIKSYVEALIPGKKGFAQVIPHYPVPALIVLHGYSKGYASMSAGVYDFIYEVNRVENEAQIRLKSVVLNNFHYEVENPQTTIDAIFNEVKKHFAVQNQK